MQVLIVSILLAALPPAFAGLILSSLDLGLTFWQCFGICMSIHMLNNLAIPSGGKSTTYIVDKDMIKELK